MTWWEILLLVLNGVVACVDIAALAVGLAVLGKVRTIVVDAGVEIRQAVASSIEEAKGEAVEEFTKALGPALAGLAAQVPVVLRQALGHLRVAPGGHLVVDHADERGPVDG